MFTFLAYRGREKTEESASERETYARSGLQGESLILRTVNNTNINRARRRKSSAGVKFVLPSR